MATDSLPRRVTKRVLGRVLPDSAYQRLLRLSYQLTSQERRVDLKELTVTGGTNSLQILKVTRG